MAEPFSRQGSLNWLVDLQKENFTGKDALQAQREAGEDYPGLGKVLCTSQKKVNR